MRCLYSLLLAVWRRIFGGAAENIKFLNNRFVQHVLGFTLCLLFLLYSDYGIYRSLIAALIFQGLFWARGHGEFFDYGHSPKPDVSRYESVWWWKYVKKYIPEKMLYSYACDFICMNVRYTLPAFLLSVVLLSIPTAFMGLALCGTYALLWAYHDLGLTNTPTKIAEILSGFLVGMLLGA